MGSVCRSRGKFSCENLTGLQKQEASKPPIQGASEAEAKRGYCLSRANGELACGQTIIRERGAALLACG